MESKGISTSASQTGSSPRLSVARENSGSPASIRWQHHASRQCCFEKASTSQPLWATADKKGYVAGLWGTYKRSAEVGAQRGAIIHPGGHRAFYDRRHPYGGLSENVKK
jgi:hypothetical protein